MFWLALAVLAVGYFWYRVQTNQQAIDAVRTLAAPAPAAPPLPPPTGRLRPAEWRAAAKAALDRGDFDACARLVQSELVDALTDAVDVPCEVIEHLQGWLQADDDGEWDRTLFRGIQASVIVSAHATAVLLVARVMLGVRRGEYLKTPSFKVDEARVEAIVDDFNKQERSGTQPFIICARELGPVVTAGGQHFGAAVRAYKVGEAGALAAAIEEAIPVAAASHERMMGVLRFLSASNETQERFRAALAASEAGESMSAPS